MYLSTLLHKQRVTQDQFLSGVQRVNSEFSFTFTGCHAMVKEYSLPGYLALPSRLGL